MILFWCHENPLCSYFFNCHTATRNAFFLINVQRCAVGEGYAVGSIQRLQVYTIEADARAGGYYGSQQFAMLSGIEARLLQLVPSFLFAHVAYLPDKVIVGLSIKPRFQYIANAKSLAVASQQSPCALHHSPEQHKRFQIILYFHFLFVFLPTDYTDFTDFFIPSLFLK